MDVIVKVGRHQGSVVNSIRISDQCKQMSAFVLDDGYSPIIHPAKELIFYVDHTTHCKAVTDNYEEN